MTWTRQFLDWDQPMLQLTAKYLVDCYASDNTDNTDNTLDLGNVIIVVPGRRAGRRLIEILIEQAELDDLCLTPPQIETVSTLTDRLVASVKPVAEPLTRNLIWAKSASEINRRELAKVIPEPPEDEDHAAWQSLAKLLESCHNTLSGEMLDFNDVATRGQELTDFCETDRWLAMAAVKERYLSHLNEMGLADPQQRYMEAIDQKQCHCDEQILLVAMVDLNGLVRAMLKQVAVAEGDKVMSLVHAPSSLSDHFDEAGCLVTKRWSEQPIDLTDEQIVIATKPTDQAIEVLKTIQNYEGQYSADQITIGLCDDKLSSSLNQLLPAHGISVRHAGGVTIGQTALFKLLGVIADYLEGQRFSDFASLARHPDMQDWLADKLGEHALTDGAIDSWLTFMDRYYSDHLQGKIIGRWLGNPEVYKPMKQLYEVANSDALLGQLVGRKPLHELAEPIRQLILEMYGRKPIQQFDKRGRVLLKVSQRLRDVLAEIKQLPESLDQICSASQVIRLVMQQVESDAIQPESDDVAIEMLGPLELQLDDADALIVTTFNEGYMPESVNADLFLPNSLRRLLGLLDNDRRYSRDAYALTAITHSKKCVKLIMGRTNVTGDLLKPSRLLFACSQERIVERANLFYPEKESHTASYPVGQIRVGQGDAFAENTWPPPPPTETLPEIQSLRVTAFRDYLACPYRFYLRHILKLNVLDDAAVEMDAAQFGNLGHDVLADFGQQYNDNPTDHKAIKKYLSEQLDHLFVQKFGSDVLPALSIQREQLRYRLFDFAKWQAEWASQGWRIVACELKIENAPLLVGGKPVSVGDKLFELRGRIDRIDRHEITGKHIIFDYKTGDTAQKPVATHLKNDKWVDLQLPLYRQLVAGSAYADVQDVGYIRLPKSDKEMGDSLTGWDRETLESAYEKAQWVIEQINAGVYYPPSEPPKFDDFAAICGVDQYLGLGASDEEGGM